MRALNELKKECMFRLGFDYNKQGCEVSICSIKKITKLTIHHFNYNKDSVIYNQFDNNDDGRLKYYANLVQECTENPTNFAILCHEHHELLEEILKLPTYEAQHLVHNVDGKYPELEVVYDETMKLRS